MNGERPGGERDLQAKIDALTSPVRREILWMLWDAELPAGEIAAGVRLTAGTVSSHLTALRRAGLVTVRVDGNFRHYRVDRAAMEAVLPLLAGSDDKWHAADDLPERGHAAASIEHWVTVNTDVGLDQEEAFASFADGERYSAWLGVPVTIADGRFSTELEWGTRVRGHYDVVAPPDLIAMRWDFDDDVTPVPGGQVVGLPALPPARGGLPGRGAPVRGRRRAGGVPHRGLADGARPVQGVGRPRPAAAATATTQAPSHGRVTVSGPGPTAPSMARSALSASERGRSVVQESPYGCPRCQEGEDQQRHRYETSEAHSVTEDEVHQLENDELAADSHHPQRQGGHELGARGCCCA